MDDMNNSNSLAQATICYPQLKAAIDINHFESWS